MTEKIIFLNTGWMDFYKGLKNDKIIGGGKDVAKMGWGGEMFNFLPFEKNLYGYVQPKIDRKYNNPSTIKIEKLGASIDDESIGGITVVWTATDPHNGGSYIIGWYKNATVFRYYQKEPRNSKRKYKNNSLGFYISAKFSNGHLLPIDERIIPIQRKKKNWMGQSNVWYADKNPSFVKLIKDYIFNGVIPKEILQSSKTKGAPRQSDPLKRIEIERKAVLFVTRHYRKLGFRVESFEKDNVGWDLTATNSKTQLKLEVKGLSGSKISAELTPNEFKNLKADKKFYRLCIVTDTLLKPKLKIFAHSLDSDEWTSKDGIIIKFQELISARVYI